MSDIRTGACHCGAVVFDVNLDEEFLCFNRCNCSWCERPGTAMGCLLLDGARLSNGPSESQLVR
ncbi:MAG TPA: hypothetical protein QGF27_03300 [Arenicellales bacterium]|jgi:hypothetical protein|nr:hypothetical protein [Arenicellales bacterium]MDP7218029.1 hypothetical protein [Arenicellales bacterium]HJP09025.1 hypothetical protein [Arenicellales bacterium]